MSLSKKWIKTSWLLIAGAIIAIDQTIKYLISVQLELNQSYMVTDFLNFTYTENKGVAFSLLNHSHDSMHYLLTAVGILITSFLIGWFWRMPVSEKRAQLALVLIIGGAIGNLIDRLILGYVRDFFHFHIMDWHFAIFNFADAAISLGACLMIIDVIFFHKSVAEKKL